MFQGLADCVVRRGRWLAAAWVLLLVAASALAPEWDSVAKNGEFDALPESTPSRQGQKLFESAFPNEESSSSIVLVVRRESADVVLSDTDRAFVAETLVPRLRTLAEHEPLLSRIRTTSDELTGPLLASQDGRAVLVIVELRSDFLDLRNREPVVQIERLLDELHQAKSVPEGLSILLSGSATIGRDLSAARAQGARAVEIMTLLLVIGLLVLIYRAPLPALIPLVTVYIAVKLSLRLLSILADHGIVGVFDGVQTYITVILYGAGVDYCLFLTARYREEIAAGATYEQGIASSLSKVGAALTASAGTVMGGIGMMVFAQFEKFREAGVAIVFSLALTLAAVLTLSALLLRAAGRWAFWPGKVGRASELETASDASSLPTTARVSGWDRVGEWILKRPGLTLVLCLGAMAPLCAVAVKFQQHVSYGFLSNLPEEAPSVRGTHALQTHFPGGITGPLAVLIESPSTDFGSTEGVELVAQLSDWLADHQEELHLADVRSVARPLGITETADRVFEGLSAVQTVARRGVLRKRGVDHYVTPIEDLAGRVTHLDLVFQHDPFARDSIARFEQLAPRLQSEFASLLPAAAQVKFVGTTVSLRDLKEVRAADQLRVNSLVCLSVFVILVALLRQPFVSLFLVLSMVLGYFATYGATLLTFWMLDPAGFPGLDWKLPMMLFTILVAVGEDYNIFLMSRVQEEQVIHGPVRGVIVGLSRTGGIISSCGVIMAGTFSALMFGSLTSLRQLGFALSFGVLLDTFVIRPIVVPAFLVLWHQRRSRSSKDDGTA